MVLVDRDGLTACVGARVTGLVNSLEVTNDRTPAAIVQVHRRCQLAYIRCAVVRCARRVGAVEQQCQLYRIARIEVVRQLVAVDARVVRCIAERTNLVLYQYVQPADVLVAAAIRNAQFDAYAAVGTNSIAAREVNIVCPRSERCSRRGAAHSAAYFDCHRTAIVIAAFVDVRCIYAREALATDRDVQLVVAYCVRLDLVKHAERTLDRRHVAAVVRNRVAETVVAHRNTRYVAVGARKDRFHYYRLGRSAYLLAILVQHRYRHIRYDFRQYCPALRASVGYRRHRNCKGCSTRERRRRVRRRVLCHTPCIQNHRASHYRICVVAHFDDLKISVRSARVAPVEYRPVTYQFVCALANVNARLILELSSQVAVSLVDVTVAKHRLNERIAGQRRAGVTVSQSREAFVALDESSERRVDNISNVCFAERDRLRAGSKVRRAKARAVLLVFHAERTRNHLSTAVAVGGYHVAHRYFQLAAVVGYRRTAGVTQTCPQFVETGRLLVGWKRVAAAISEVVYRSRQDNTINVVAHQIKRDRSSRRSRLSAGLSRIVVNYTGTVAVNCPNIRTRQRRSCRVVAGSHQQCVSLVGLQRQYQTELRVGERHTATAIGIVGLCNHVLARIRRVESTLIQCADDIQTSRNVACELRYQRVNISLRHRESVQIIRMLSIGQREEFLIAAPQ